MQERKLNVDRIKQTMGEFGLNQTALADKIDVSKEAVSKWLKSEKFPRPAKLLELSKLLKLPFQEIVLHHNSEIPITAYRTNKRKKITEAHQLKARDMGEILKVLLPYLNSDSVFTAPKIKNPVLEQSYIQKVASEVRNNEGLDSKEITFSEIMRLYSDFRIILIPVMWGPDGNNGLYINLPKNQITFVYANLEKVITDFKFWLLHELAHAMTPSLKGNDSEKFADSFAAAVLFPRDLAKETYDELLKIRQPGIVVNRIKELASRYVISPYTILREMEKYAKSESKSVLKIEMGGAITNFNKQVGLVSEIIFGEENPDAEKYIKVCTEVFKTEFFSALSAYIKKNNKEAGIVQRLMDIPIADAKGVYRALVDK